MKCSSSGVRFPRVFSRSMSRRSMVCLASGRLGGRASPVSGCGASPRCTKTDEPRESTNV